jgi:uncharacterized caspase-like protein
LVGRHDSRGSLRRHRYPSRACPTCALKRETRAGPGFDARLERDIDVEDEAIPLDRILRVLEPAKSLRLVILDACRDNPFVRTMKRTLASRSFGRGLARA